MISKKTKRKIKQEIKNILYPGIIGLKDYLGNMLLEL